MYTSLLVNIYKDNYTYQERVLWYGFHIKEEYIEWDQEKTKTEVIKSFSQTKEWLNQWWALGYIEKKYDGYWRLNDVGN